MQITSESVENLVDQLARLPTVGRKTAQRLAAYVLKMPREEVVRLADALVEAKDRVRYCRHCFTATDDELCPICRSSRRDRSTICVVQEPGDVVAVERTGEYRGVYHVLGGVISPLDGVGPEALRIGPLVSRASDGTVREVVLALPATVDGQTTAHYLAERLQPAGVTVSMLARGVPVGGELDWLDDGTIAQAMRARRPA